MGGRGEDELMWFHVTAVGSDGVERGAWVVDAESAADARSKGQRGVFRCTVAGKPL